MTMSLVNWNVKWATPRSERTPEVLRRIDLHNPDVICLTETDKELLSPDGYAICAQADYGYGLIRNRRKVMLWSREPWERADDLGHESMPPGRYVSGVTRTPLGRVTVIGICIPWSGSRTDDNRGPDRKRHWEDHESYLEALSELLKGMRDRPLIIVGDFNQRMIRRNFVPRKLRSALRDAIPEHMTLATAVLGHRGRRIIDHLVLSDDLAAESLSVISNIDGKSNLSDHLGVAGTLSTRDRVPD